MSKLAEDEWAAWIALRLIKGIGNVVGLRLIETFGGPREVLAAGSQRLECAGLRRRVARAVAAFDQWSEVEEQLRRLDRSGGRLVTWLDESYPERLRHIHDPPMFLFVRGSLDEVAPKAARMVAVVGSRTPSPYGRRMSRAFASDLAGGGIAVVSGLARGVDGEAHSAVLRAGGKTIAVLGCGIDVVYPREHYYLMMQVAENGAVVSEFAMGTQPDAENFPGRNRIISGMSLGVVVIEAAESSGSLITAHYAAEQGREVFAVPGPVGERSRGCHRLIRDGAHLVESANDVLQEVAPQRVGGEKPALETLTINEAAVLACVGDVATPVDEIVRACGLDLSATLEILLGLELRGLVRPQPGKCYALEEAGRPRGKSV